MQARRAPQLQLVVGTRRNHSCRQLSRRVTAIHEESIDIELKDGAKQSLPFGTCIWAAGVGMHPLVRAAGGCCRRSSRGDEQSVRGKLLRPACCFCFCLATCAPVEVRRALPAGCEPEGQAAGGLADVSQVGTGVCRRSVI